jgi:hypothetical protein
MRTYQHKVATFYTRQELRLVAEAAIISAALATVGAEPNMLDPVATLYEASEIIEPFLAAVQDALYQDHGIWTDLTGASLKQVKDLAGGDFSSVASYLVKKIAAATGAKSAPETGDEEADA